MATSVSDRRVIRRLIDGSCLCWVVLLAQSRVYKLVSPLDILHEITPAVNCIVSGSTLIPNFQRQAFLISLELAIPRHDLSFLLRNCCRIVHQHLELE